MNYITAKQIKKEFGERLLFSFEELVVRKGDKIGLVGANGSGKTTLLNILSGEIEPDTGTIERQCEISFFRQFSTQREANDFKLLKEFHVSEKQNQYTVSGGENTRLRLVQALGKNSPVLFADEPTSNLDLAGIELLKQKLKEVETLVLISHDRDILDALCTRMIEIREQKLFFYTGNYSDYKRVKEEHDLARMREYELYAEQKAYLERIYQQKKKRAHEVGKRPKNLDPKEARVKNFLSSRPYDTKQQHMESAAKSILSRIEHLQVKEKPKEQPVIRPDFSLTDPPKNRIVLEGKKITFAYPISETRREEDRKILDHANFSILNGKKIALLGDNGAGKSTLLNLIMTGYTGIRKVPKVKIGFFRQNFENLEEEKSVLENAMKESVQEESVVRNVLNRLLLPKDFISKPVFTLSGGEKVKLSFAKLFVSGANLLLLDEPTNYLDIASVEALCRLFSEYEGTVLFASHDRSFIREVATGILEIKNGKLIQFDEGYDSYLKRKNGSARQNDTKILIMKLEMELSALSFRLSQNTDEKEQLEQQFQKLSKDLYELKKKH